MKNIIATVTHNPKNVTTTQTTPVAQVVEIGNASALTLGAGQVNWETSRPLC
jgi:hypothetical protein